MLAQATPLPPSSQPRRPLAVLDPNVPSAPARGSSTASRPAIPENGDELAELVENIPESAVLELQARILFTDRPSDEAESTAAEDTISFDPLNDADAEAAARDTTADAEKEEEAVMLIENADIELENSSATTSEQFIARYAKYNIVDSYWLGRYCTRNQTSDISVDDISNYVMVGGSRDPPQPMIHHCSKTPGCPVWKYQRDALKSHELICTELRVKQLHDGADKLEDYVCPYDGCPFAAAPGSETPSKLLAQHVKWSHDHEAKACEHGCDPEKLYYDAPSYRHHLDHEHSARWPAKCRVIGCTHEGDFAVHSSLKYHLKSTHKLDDEAMAQYIPALPPKRKWVKQGCFIDRCKTSFSFFTSQAFQIEHMKRLHGFDLEGAKTQIEQHGKFQIINPKPVVGRKRKPSAKDTKDAATADVPPAKKTKLVPVPDAPRSKKARLVDRVPDVEEPDA